MQILVVTEIAFVAFGDLLLRASGFGHGSVTKQSHECVPEREHEQEKRNGRMNEQPGMQPMLQLQLQIQHAALVAPRLDFLDAIPIRFGDTEFDETKCVLGKARVAQAKPVAAFGCEVRKNLSIQKIEE